MNLEIKDGKEEIWEKIQELIEKYEYYDQISICSFNSKFYEKVETYNKEYNRTIVFGFLDYHPFNINYGRPNHQISLNALTIKYNQDIVKKAHDNGMTVGVYFFIEPQQYYDLFEIGVDVIISDYPIRVAKQLNEYYIDKIKLEGCKSIEKNSNNISSCKSCQNGYELVKIKEQNRNLCKLKYEIDPDLYVKDPNGVYHEKNIFAIKMLMSPFENYTICQKNGKTIFYFEWRFDLYGYDYGVVYDYDYGFEYNAFESKFILSKNRLDYSTLTEKHIKKLNFNRIEIYVDNNLINSTDFLCIDLYDMDYYVIYTVMGAHCYFIYNGEQKTSYSVKFRLFDDNYLSFVTYDNTFLSNKDSWEKSKIINFYSDPNPDSLCSKIKDPFQERISCINKINTVLAGF